MWKKLISWLKQESPCKDEVHAFRYYYDFVEMKWEAKPLEDHPCACGKYTPKEWEVKKLKDKVHRLFTAPSNSVS